MSLSQCQECGKEISNTAKLCPHCGAKYPTGKKTSKVTWVIGGVFAFIVGSIAIGSIDNKSTPKPEKTAEQKREDDEFNSRIQSARAAMKLIQTNLYDPRSVEWVNIYSSKEGDVACLKYRAKNKLGAYVLSSAVMRNLKLSNNSNEVKKHCSEPMYDITKTLENLEKL